MWPLGDRFCQFINCQMTGGKDQSTPLSNEQVAAGSQQPAVDTAETSSATSNTGADGAKPDEKKPSLLSRIGTGSGNVITSAEDGLGNWQENGYDLLGKAGGDFIKENAGRP